MLPLIVYSLRSSRSVLQTATRSSYLWHCPSYTRTMADFKPNNDIPRHEMVYFPQMTTALPASSGEFRKVLFTGLYSQVVLMTIPVGFIHAFLLNGKMLINSIQQRRHRRWSTHRWPGVDVHEWSREGYSQWKGSRSEGWGSDGGAGWNAVSIHQYRAYAIGECRQFWGALWSAGSMG